MSRSKISSCEYIYGINPAFEAVRAGRRRMFLAVVNSAAKPGGRLQKLLSLLGRAGIRVERADKGRLSQLCGSSEHQGVVLECGAYPYVTSESLMDSHRILLLDNIEDPQNAGAILRSAEVFGWRNVFMSTRGTPGIYPSVVRASAGATEHLAVAKDLSAIGCFRLLAEHGFTVVALDGGGSESLDDVRALPIGKLALVIGGEHKSVGQYILNNAHHIVAIPQLGSIGSLNASVAAGIALFELADMRRQPSGRAGGLRRSD